MKQYNPKTVLRQTSNDLLKALFEQVGHPLEVSWETLGPRQVQDVYDAFLRLPESGRREVEVVFHDLHALARADGGIRHLVEAAAFAGYDIADDLDRHESRYDKAAWVLLNYPQVWEKAAMLAQVDALQNRSWHRRSGLPRREPDTTKVAIQALQADLSAFFWQAEGRGKLCRIDHLRRHAAMDYFFVYLSDHSDTEITWDEAGNWQRIKHCHAFEVVYVYDRRVGSLDLYAQGGHRVIEPLQVLFAQAMLGWPLPPADPGECPYRLHRLKDCTMAFETDPEDGITQVSVRLLCVSPLGNPRKRITVQLPPGAAPDDLHLALERDLNNENLPLSLLRVEKARIAMRLEGHGRSRSLTFNLTPRTCSLKSKPEHLRELGEKYLRRWGLEAV